MAYENWKMKQEKTQSTSKISLIKVQFSNVIT